MKRENERILYNFNLCTNVTSSFNTSKKQTMEQYTVYYLVKEYICRAVYNYFVTHI
jgi:hypothetical protein